MINDGFVTGASKLSFSVALPALLFISIFKAEVDATQNFSLVVYGLAATLVVFVVLELSVSRFVKEKADRGVVVQGSFRSNMGIIGLAYCVNAFGDEGFGTAALYLAFVTILYNILAVITLTRWLSDSPSRKALIVNVFLGVIKNPLILAIGAALLLKSLHVPLPKSLQQSGTYLAQMALPLALLCAGASLKFKRDAALQSAIIATVLRLMVIPTLMTTGGFLLGFRGIELGVLFMMSAAPAAAASYTMVRAMHGNSTLAANIIAMTTCFSLFTTALGAMILRGFGLLS